MEEKKTLLYLPQELITLILLRLPVKSLIRFKCVCKSWFSLISDTYFANSHFQLAATTPTRRILLLSAPAARDSRSIDFEASLLDDDSDHVSLYPSFMPFQSYSRIQIKGSCRGFLLLHCYHKQCWIYESWIYDIYVWNPSTGFHKKIPSSPFASHSGGIHDYTDLYGFGYDHSTDDYLLVTMSSEISNDPPPPHLEFFSLRANTWKEIESTQSSWPIGNEPPTSGFLFNGAIHWVAYRRDLIMHVDVAFDLRERKLFNMHLPDDFVRGFKLNDFGLWVFGEFLSLWAVYYGDVRDKSTLEIWVMKEYKVDSPWTKTLVLPFGGTTRKIFPPICSTKSGDIIGTNGHTGLEKYNDQVQLLEHNSYFKFNSKCGWQVALYIESLLSLPDNEQAQEEDSNKKNEVLKYSPLPFS